MLDLIGGGSQQSASRSGTPAVGVHRKSPTADQGTQVYTQNKIQLLLITNLLFLFKSSHKLSSIEW